MRGKKVFFPLLVFLTACAAQVDTVYLTRMNGMIGRSEGELIEAWGVPDKNYVMDDHTKVVTYTRTNDYMTAGGFGTSGCVGSVPGTGIGYSTCIGVPPSRLQRYYCDVTFEIAQGRIRRWGQEGNDCPVVK